MITITEKYYKLVSPSIIMLLFCAFSGVAMPLAYGAPIPEDISPRTGELGDTVEISLSGTGFAEAATVSITPPMGVIVKNVTFVSSSLVRIQVRIDVDSPLGYRNITLANPDGSTAVFSKAFKIINTNPSPEPSGSSMINLGISGGIAASAVALLKMIRGKNTLPKEPEELPNGNGKKGTTQTGENVTLPPEIEDNLKRIETLVKSIRDSKAEEDLLKSMRRFLELVKENIGDIRGNIAEYKEDEEGKGGRALAKKYEEFYRETRPQIKTSVDRLKEAVNKIEGRFLEISTYLKMISDNFDDLGIKLKKPGATKPSVKGFENDIKYIEAKLKATENAIGEAKNCVDKSLRQIELRGLASYVALFFISAIVVFFFVQWLGLW